MKKYLQLLGVFIILFGTILTNSTYVYAEKKFGNEYEDWKKLNITSKPKKPLSEEDIDTFFSTHPDSLFLDPEAKKALLRVSKESGINPYIFLLMGVVESAWGQSPVAHQQKNLGGVRCTPRATDGCHQYGRVSCKGLGPTNNPCYSSYKNFDDYFDDKAFFLNEYYIKEGVVEMKPLLEIYAPESEYPNNHHSYLMNMRGNLKAQLGYDLDDITSDEVLVAGKDYGDDKEPFTKEEIEIFKQSLAESSKLGMSNTGNTLEESPYIDYGFKQITQKIYNFMMFLSYIFIALVIIYMSAMVFIYALYVNNNVGNKVATKVLGEQLASTYGDRRGIIMILKRMLFGIVLISFLLSGMIPKLFSGVYQVIEGFITSI